MKTYSVEWSATCAVSLHAKCSELFSISKKEIERKHLRQNKNKKLKPTWCGSFINEWPKKRAPKLLAIFWTNFSWETLFPHRKTPYSINHDIFSLYFYRFSLAWWIQLRNYFQIENLNYSGTLFGNPCHFKLSIKKWYAMHISKHVVATERIEWNRCEDRTQSNFRSMKNAFKYDGTLKCVGHYSSTYDTNSK